MISWTKPGNTKLVMFLTPILVVIFLTTKHVKKKLSGSASDTMFLCYGRDRMKRFFTQQEEITFAVAVK